MNSYFRADQQIKRIKEGMADCQRVKRQADALMDVLLDVEEQTGYSAGYLYETIYGSMKRNSESEFERALRVTLAKAYDNPSIKVDDIASIEDAAKGLSAAYIIGDSYKVNDILYGVERDTGYNIDFLYDIFVENIEDETECEPDLDISQIIYGAADRTISVAYEQDY